MVAIDLFAGAGGMSTGAKLAGIDVSRFSGSIEFQQQQVAIAVPSLHAAAMIEQMQRFARPAPTAATCGDRFDSRTERGNRHVDEEL